MLRLPIRRSMQRFGIAYWFFRSESNPEAIRDAMFSLAYHCIPHYKPLSSNSPKHKPRIALSLLESEDISRNPLLDEQNKRYAAGDFADKSSGTDYVIQGRSRSLQSMHVGNVLYALKVQARKLHAWRDIIKYTPFADPHSRGYYRVADKLYICTGEDKS